MVQPADVALLCPATNSRQPVQHKELKRLLVPVATAAAPASITPKASTHGMSAAERGVLI